MTTQRTLECFGVDAVKQEPLLTATSELPFSKEILDGLLANCPVVLVDIDAPQHGLPFNDEAQVAGVGATDTQLSRVSSVHKRSMEVVLSDLPDSWTDEYGNVYRGLSLKGNNFSKPGIMQHPTAPDGFIAYGLQESNVIERTLAASKLLRARGIPTENIIGLAEPKSYPWPVLGTETDATETLSLSEYKSRIIQQYWQDLPEAERTSDALIDLYGKFKDMTFYVSLRATDSPFRLHDLRDLNIRRQVFAEYNAGEHSDGTEPLNPENLADTERYMRECWNPRAARNFAKLHTDLAHRFAHGFNLTATGSFVDLDSIHGEPLGLGDEPITHEDRALDLAEVLNASARMAREGSFILGRSVDMQVEFMEHYFAEAAALYEGENVAENIGAIMVALFHELSEVTSTGNDVMIDKIQEGYDQKYLGIVAGKEQLGGAFRAVAEALDEDTISRYMTDILEYTWPERVMDVLSNHINEINDAKELGTEICLFDSFIKESGEVHSGASHELEEELESLVMLAVAEAISEGDMTSIPGLESIQNSSIKVLAASNLMNLYSESVQSVVDAQLEKLIDRQPEELRATATLRIPESVFVGADSYLQSGAHPGLLFRATDGISRERVESLLPDAKHPVEYGTFTLSKLQSVDMMASQPGNLLLEMVSHTYFDGLQLGVSDGQAEIKVEFHERPDYVLLVEECPDGTRLLRYLRPEVIPSPSTEVQSATNDWALFSA